MIGSYIKYYNIDDTDDFIINDRESQPNLWADDPFYFISIVAIDGLYNADISYESHPLPNSVGEISGDVLRRGKTITLSGKINAMSLPYLAQGAEYLQQMFADAGPRKLVFLRLSDGVEVYYKGRVNQDLVIVETVQSGKYEWDWVVGIRCDSPYSFNADTDDIDPDWQI